MGLLMWKANEKDDIKAILDMVEQGIVKPAIDKVYSFADSLKAFEYCWGGNAKGKVVLKME
jgi:alcohol dehydrogenase